MKSILLGALMALTITTVHGAENAANAGRFLPECKAFLDNNTSGIPTSGTALQGFCGGMVVGIALIAQPLFAPGQSRGVPNGAWTSRKTSPTGS